MFPKKIYIVITFLCLLYFLGTLKTSFLSGSTFNVTWHLAYPHRVSKSSLLLSIKKGFGMVNDVQELSSSTEGIFCTFLTFELMHILGCYEE